MTQDTKKSGADGRENLPQNLVVWSSDVRFLQGTVEGWCAFWGGEEGATSLSAPELDPAGFETEVRSLPMWRERQVVRLRHAERAPAKLIDALSIYFDKPSPGTALLVEYTGDLGKKAPEAWKEIVRKVDARDCGPRGVAAYLRVRARAEGYTVRAEAAEALEEWACGDMGKLVSALDLLFLYRAEEKTVSVEDVESLLGAGGAPKMWDLQDAFLRGDRRGFLALLEGVERDKDAAALAFLGMVAKQVRALLAYAGLKERGRKASEITYRELGLTHPFQAQKLLGVADRWPEARVRSAFGSLYALDLALKSKHKDADEWAVLEQALLKIL
jgi:DNA polymerase III delta subunit